MKIMESMKKLKKKHTQWFHQIKMEEMSKKHEKLLNNETQKKTVQVGNEKLDWKNHSRIP